MNITSTQSHQTVNYKKPIIRRTEIGRKPVHKFDQNPDATESYVSTADDPFKKGEFKVWADIPDKTTDGNPVMTSVEETLDMRPRSVWKYGGIAGGVGALVGAGAGFLLSNAAGVAPEVGAAVGALAVGGVAGGIGALMVHGEKTKLVWDEHQIIDHKMLGYKELVGPGSKGEQSGYFHRYVADIESKNIGSFKTPRVLRYKGDVAPEQKVATPVKDTAPDDIPKGPTKELDVTVSYEKERLQSRYLGSIPSDHWSYSGWSDGYTSCGPNGCNVGGRSIYRDTPVYEPDGEPRVDAVTERIQASPYSVPLFGLGGLAAGGAVGFGLGMALAHFTGLPSTITAGAVAGVAGIAAGLGAANYAAGDHVKLEWRENSIQEKRLAGYTETVTPHYETRCTTTTDSEGNSKQECETYQNGWNHHFSPDVRYWEVGTYVAPKVVHYQKKDGELQPKEQSQEAAA